MTVNPVAAGGFSAAASTYARIRPTYARRAVGAVADAVRGHPAGSRILDVGAGTGILTGQLARLGFACTALEPLEPMARQLRLALPQVPLIRGTAEALPFRDGAFTVYTSAQAFHWFETQTALQEAARVLVPGGELFLVWNLRDESVGWVAELDALVEARAGGRPYTDHRDRPWSDAVARSGLFDPLAEERFPNPVVTDVEGVLERLRSTSFVAAMDEAPRAELVEEARAMLDAKPHLAGRFEYPHTTVLYRSRRLA